MAVPVKRARFGALNMRDLGGIPVPGGCIPWGRFWRSGVPDAISAEGISFLKSMGVLTILDLRSRQEREQSPSLLEKQEGFSCHWVPLLGGTLPQKEDDVADLYWEAASDPSMAEALRIILHAPGGVLFHCTAGKDRTGVTAALLLSLAGAEECDIVADYQVSHTYLEELLRTMRQARPDLPAFLGLSKPEYMRGFLERLKKSGGAEAHLSRLGLSPDEISLLKTRLAPAAPGPDDAGGEAFPWQN